MDSPPPPAPRWAHALVDWLVRRRRWSVAVLLLAMAAAIPLARGWFQADNSARVWLLEDDPALVAYERFQDLFGNDEVVIVAVRDPRGVVRPAPLERVRALARRLEASPLVRRVASLATTRHVAGDAVEIRVDPVLPGGTGDAPIGEAEAREVERRLADDPRVAERLLDPSGTVTLVIAELVTVDQMEGKRPAILSQVVRAVDEEIRGHGLEAHLGGIGVVYEAINRAVVRDSIAFVGLAFGVIIIGLWLLFRRLVWVGVGVAIISMSTVLVAGIFGATGGQMNMVTSIVPTLILTVGILDLVHLVEARDEAAETGRTTTAAIAAVMVPCVFNTVTDAIGFAALTSARMGGVREFGLIAAAGLVLLLCATLAIAVPPLVRGVAPVRRRQDGWMLAVVRGLARFTRRRHYLVLGGGVVAVSLAVLGMTRLTVDTYTIEFLRADHPARQDHRAIESSFGPYLPLELTVATAPGAVYEPAVLRAIDRAERAVEAHPRIGAVNGLPDVVARINQVVMEGAAEALVIPGTREAVAQELLLFDSAAAGELDRLVDPEQSLTRVTARTLMTTARGLAEVIRDIERRAGDEVGTHGTVETAGYLPLYVRIIRHITRAQVSSFAIAFALVCGVLALLLRSWRLGLIAMVPNLLPVMATLGLMGFAGIRLDVGTVLVASIAIGISVNDTSHLMFRYRSELRATPGDREGALERTLTSTGRAVFASSLLLCAGFAVLAVASTRSIANFGMLSALTVVFALAADLILTPALLRALGPSRA